MFTTQFAALKFMLLESIETTSCRCLRRATDDVTAKMFERERL